MLGGIAAFAGLVVFITAHEAGHFLAAKATGVKATQFFFGFGPRIWSKQVGETEYGVKALPLGGYVRIIGMNPLEEVAAQDLGRTYREKKFWEKSFVVVAGVGTNFLLGFLLFWGVFWANGMTDLVPTVDEVVPQASVMDGVVVADGAAGATEVASPAIEAGLRAGDEIVAVGDTEISTWEDMTSALEAEGPGPTTVTVLRDGSRMTLDANLLANTTMTGETTGYLGVRPTVVDVAVGPFESLGLAGQAVWEGVGNTFQALYEIFRPSSLAQYVGVLGGDTDVPDNIRPISPIGIVSIGSQLDNAASFFLIMAYINVFVATFNLLPLIPLDGGHFAIALYEKVTGRQANMNKLMPIAVATTGTLIFLFLIGAVLDIFNPINFG